jgi:PKD repeat protein
MKKTLTFTLLFIFIIALHSEAQEPLKRLSQKSQMNFSNGFNTLKVDTLNNITQTISNVLFGGCVTVSNLTYTGPNLSIGYFVDTSGTLGIDSGLIMTTGSVAGIENPGSFFASSANLGNSDPDLDSQIPGYSTYDASIIEFDFVPLADTLIGCNYIFASEEYPEWVGSAYNDVFGFFISGPGIIGTQNLALIPGTNIPVAINNVNATSYSQYYIDNQNGANWCYDAYTTPFTITFPVTPGALYHFKIAIGDAGDQIFDSGVFLKGGSFLGNTQLPTAKFSSSINQNTVSFSNMSENARDYNWDFGDGSTSNQENPIHAYAFPGQYNVKLECSNYCFTQSATSQVAIQVPPGITSYQDPFSISTTRTSDNYLDVKIVRPDGNVTLNLYSISGLKILSETLENGASINKSIDLSSLTNGLYYITIIDQKHKKTIKFIK